MFRDPLREPLSVDIPTDVSYGEISTHAAVGTLHVRCLSI